MPKLRLLSATRRCASREDDAAVDRDLAALRPLEPAMERSVVVLPQPDGPSSVKNRPFSDVEEMSIAAFTGGPFVTLYSVLSAPTLSTSEILHAEAAAQNLRCEHEHEERHDHHHAERRQLDILARSATAPTARWTAPGCRDC